MLWTICLLLIVFTVGALYECNKKSNRKTIDDNVNYLHSSHDDYEFDGLGARDYNPSTGMPMSRCAGIRCGVDASGKFYGED